MVLVASVLLLLPALMSTILRVGSTQAVFCCEFIVKNFKQLENEHPQAIGDVKL